MDFVRVQVAFRDDPKVVGLSDAAYRLYVDMLLWVGYHETDGALRGSWDPALKSELLQANLWEEAGEGGLAIHNYLEHNPSHADLEAKRIAGRNAARTRWSRAKGNAVRTAERDADPNTEVRGKREHINTATKEGFSLADSLVEQLKARGVVVTGKQRSAWAKQADKLLKTEPLAKATEMLTWSMSDSNGFVVASMKAFCDKYPAMVVYRQKSNGARPAEARPKLQDLRVVE